MDARKWWDAHYAAFIEDLRALIAVPSVSDEAAGTASEPYGRACADVLETARGIAERLGFGFVNAGNHYGLLIWKGREESTVGIFSHLDVVPAGSGWEYEPFDVTRKDDMLIGRGTSDNKGPALAVMYSLAFLRDSGWQPEHTIIQFLGVNEECGMHDIERFRSEHRMPLFSLVPDARFPVCICEKGLLEIDAERPVADDSVIVSWSSGVASNSVPGLAEAVVSISLDKLAGMINDSRVSLNELSDGKTAVEAKGMPAHAAAPENGESAQNILASALLGTGLFPESDEMLFRDIRSLFSDCSGAGLGVPYEDEISGKLTHVGGFSSISEDGRVFRQNINIRYPASADHDAMVEAIAGTLGAHGFSIVREEGSLPSHTDPDLPLIRTLTEICCRKLGMELVPYSMGGGTYARCLENAAAYGPGIPGEENRMGAGRGRGHQSDEYITEDKLWRCFSVYSEAIPAVDSGTGENI